MRRVAYLLVCLVVCATSVTALPVSAQEAAQSFNLTLISGTCAAPGDPASSLTPLTGPAGEGEGSSDASAVTRSYSTIPTSIDTLLASPHAIAVSDDANMTVACGNLGGARDDSGALAIGLQATGGSGWAGIAYLGPVSGNSEQTGISTFVAHLGSQGIATPAVAADQYAPTMRSQVSLVVASLQRIDVLFNTPNATDPQWVNQVLAECSLWHMLYREAEAITPPDAYVGFHQRYLEALALLDSAADDISVGLTTSDAARLQEAEPKILEAVGILRSLDNGGSPATPGSTPVATGERKLQVQIAA